jgi:hypothetical protein
MFGKNFISPLPPTFITFPEDEQVFCVAFFFNGFKVSFRKQNRFQTAKKRQKESQQKHQPTVLFCLQR